MRWKSGKEVFLLNDTQYIKNRTLWAIRLFLVVLLFTPTSGVQETAGPFTFAGRFAGVFAIYYGLLWLFSKEEDEIDFSETETIEETLAPTETQYRIDKEWHVATIFSAIYICLSTAFFILERAFWLEILTYAATLICIFSAIVLFKMQRPSNTQAQN